MFIEQKAKQSNFFYLCKTTDPTKRKQQSPEIDEICTQAFDNVNQRWLALGFETPTTDNLTVIGTVAPNNPNLSVYLAGEGGGRLILPKVKNVEVPGEFSEFLEYYCSHKKGVETPLPPPWSAKSFFDLNFDPKIEDLFCNSYDEYETWLTGLVGSDISISNRPANLFIWLKDSKNPNRKVNYRFSLKGALTGMTTEQPRPVQSQKAQDIFAEAFTDLKTQASFRGGKLTRLWWEVPNGTLFPDPRGERENIYPHWLKGRDEFLTGHSWEPGNSNDWDKYLECIGAGRQVISGRTLNYVRQTEKQARANLESWRDYIYHMYPQVFYFRRTPQSPGFIAAEGYRKFGRYGSYVVKNQTSYKELNLEDSVDRISNWLNSLDDSSGVPAVGPAALLHWKCH